MRELQEVKIKLPLCGGTALEVELHWESSPNSRAIGAELRLRTQNGTLYREMSASSGYLSSDSARVHFGLGQQTGESPIISK